MEKANSKNPDTINEIPYDGMLSVVLPAYKLRSVLARNIKKVEDILKNKIKYEIIPVDDGSNDGSAAILESLASPTVRPVVLPQNYGKGEALKRGFLHSRGDFILLLDADLDINPESIFIFFDIMRRERADIVIGSKRHPLSNVYYPWHRKLASATYYILLRILLGVNVSDTQTGMKLFTRNALKYAFNRMLVKAFAFDVEMLAVARSGNFIIAEAPVKIAFGDKLGCLSLPVVYQILIDTMAIFYRKRILNYYQNVMTLPEAKDDLKFSVIVACPAESDYLRECITGLETQTYKNFEVLILPDFDLPKNYTNYKVIPTGKIRPAEKRNIGAAAATGEILVFLDDDAFPANDWLEMARPHFEAQDLTALGGPGITPETDDIWASRSGMVFSNILVSGEYRYRYSIERHRNSILDYPSCNLFVRKSAFDDVKGFRTDFWPGEDTMLCDSLIANGARIAYDPNVIVKHHRRKLFLPHLRQVARYAEHRGYFAKKFKASSLKLSYMLPTLFTAGLIVGLPMSFFFSWAAILYSAVVIFYLLTTLIFSIQLNLKTIFFVWLGVIATHLTYGVFFLKGLLSSRMPCEVKNFDHPTDKK